MFSLGGLKALTNGNMKIHKVLALPSFLEEDSIYFVKNGVGADLYMVSNDGDAIKVSSGVDYGLTLGETSSTAYQGDRGKFAYDHALSPHVANQTDIGLGHVNNTSDLNKPVSTATQAALDALTKADVGLGNVDNTSDIDKPVSTLQQAAIDAAGGSSFDQDLNTTDSPTFNTLTTTNTIATDVFTVDLGASGTVTAAEGVFNTPTVGSQYALEVQSNGSKNFTVDGYGNVESKSLLPRSANVFNVGASNRRWKEVFTGDVDASGTVTADEVSTDTFQIASGVYQFKVGSTVVAAFTPGNAEVRGNHFPTYDDLYNSGASYKRWREVFTGDLDASGTVTAGGFVGTPQTLTDAASITYDLANGHNAKVTLTDDRILLFPTNIAEGASGVLTVTQDGTGGRALTFGTGWFISAGAAADIAALGAGEKAQVTWYAHSSSDVNATILPLQ